MSAMNSKQLVARNDRSGLITSAKPMRRNAALLFGAMMRGIHQGIADVRRSVHHLCSGANRRGRERYYNGSYRYDSNSDFQMRST
jgi:hypothetical protein